MPVTVRFAPSPTGNIHIGNARTTRLKDILSERNAEYMRIIDEQQRGEFRPVCASCDFYKSVYHQRSEYRRSRAPMQTVDDFKAKLGASRQPVSGQEKAAP